MAPEESSNRRNDRKAAPRRHPCTECLSTPRWTPTLRVEKVRGSSCVHLAILRVPVKQLLVLTLASATALARLDCVVVERMHAGQPCLCFASIGAKLRDLVPADIAVPAASSVLSDAATFMLELFLHVTIFS